MIEDLELFVQVIRLETGKVCTECHTPHDGKKRGAPFKNDGGKWHRVRLSQEDYEYVQLYLSGSLSGSISEVIAQARRFAPGGIDGVKDCSPRDPQTGRFVRRGGTSAKKEKKSNESP